MQRTEKQDVTKEEGAGGEEEEEEKGELPTTKSEHWLLSIEVNPVLPPTFTSIYSSSQLDLLALLQFPDILRREMGVIEQQTFSNLQGIGLPRLSFCL